MHLGGTAACALNAANEIAVEAFLNEYIPFLAIAEINEETMRTTPLKQVPVYEDYVETDRAAREVATQLVSKFKK